MRRKKKSPFIIYVDFGSILVSSNNGKQNSKESCTNKYQIKKTKKNRSRKKYDKDAKVNEKLN